MMAKRTVVVVRAKLAPKAKDARWSVTVARQGRAGNSEGGARSTFIVEAASVPEAEKKAIAQAKEHFSLSDSGTLSIAYIARHAEKDSALGANPTTKPPLAGDDDLHSTPTPTLIAKRNVALTQNPRLATAITAELDRRKRALGANRMETGDADGVRIVHNKLLGGWYVVRGPHQSPLGGRHASKAEAEEWLRSQKAARGDAMIARGRDALRDLRGAQDARPVFTQMEIVKKLDGWVVQARMDGRLLYAKVPLSVAASKTEAWHAAMEKWQTSAMEKWQRGDSALGARDDAGLRATIARGRDEIARLIGHDAGFEESKHKRAANGEFGSGGGGEKLKRKRGEIFPGEDLHVYKNGRLDYGPLSSDPVVAAYQKKVDAAIRKENATGARNLRAFHAARNKGDEAEAQRINKEDKESWNRFVTWLEALPRPKGTDASFIARGRDEIARLIGHDAGFEESKHKRAANGEFGSGGGGKSGGGKEPSLQEGKLHTFSFQIGGHNVHAQGATEAAARKLALSKFPGKKITWSTYQGQRPHMGGEGIHIAPKKKMPTGKELSKTHAQLREAKEKGNHAEVGRLTKLAEQQRQEYTKGLNEFLHDPYDSKDASFIARGRAAIRDLIDPKGAQIARGRDALRALRGAQRDTAFESGIKDTDPVEIVANKDNGKQVRKKFKTYAAFVRWADTPEAEDYTILRVQKV